jgi:hypothetical protein
LFGVLARVAAKLFVVDFQIRHRAARLTPPAVTTQDLPLKIRLQIPAKRAKELGFQSKSV